MRETKRISVADIERDIEQPRKQFDEQEMLALGKNMLAIGQQVPLLVYCPEILASDKNAKRYRLVDGECRWRGAQVVGMTEVDAIVLSERPSEKALPILQMSLEAHKHGLTPMERSNLLQRIRTENNWQVIELAEKLQMKQPLVSKLLAYQKLDPSIQAMLHNGELDMVKALTISQEPDPAKQRELVKGAASLSREELHQKAKGLDKAASVKTGHARFPLSTGLCVTVQGREVTLSAAIEAMQETVKELKRAQSQFLDITTAQRVFKDKAKSR